MSVVAAILLFGATAFAQAPPADEPTIQELLNAADDVARGDSSISVMEMHVKTKRYERTMRMKTWARGTESTLIRIESPAKDAGMCTLKVDKNIWNYLPKIDRTMKVPSGMMGGNWMGSHFTNDDLVKENRLSEDFTYEMTERPGDNPEGVYVITLIPTESAAVVWGKIVARISPDKLPVRMEYYDEGGADGSTGELVRTMSFEAVQEFNGRKVPTLMRLQPVNKPDEFTEIRYLSFDFDTEIPDSTFTLQALKP